MASDTFRVFVSLPMRGRTIDEIRSRQQKIFEKFALGEWELMDTIHEDETPEEGNNLWYLGRSIQTLGKADIVIFATNWREAKGCHVEHAICELYGIPYVYERELNI